MADLENFFAKKDKKKKSKKVEIVPDELLKKIELDTTGLVDNGYDSNGDQPPKVLTTLPLNKTQDDEEWEQFEGEKEIDLSTLKIQNLGEMEKERQEVEEQEELQKAVEESKSTMKWNITRKEESSDDEEAEEPPAAETPTNGDQENNSAANNNNNVTKEGESAPSDAAPAPAANKRYIPPALRGQNLGQSQDVRSMSAASGPTLEKLSIKRTTAKNQKIDVNSTDQFPSLGMAVQNSPGRGFGSGQDTSSFTSVRKGARNVQESTPDQKGLSTSNKFSVLKSNRT